VKINRALETSSEKAIEILRARTDTIVLAFSRGKDATAAWLTLRNHFKIIPVYMAVVPGMAFIEDSLRYFEDWFRTPIIREVHPSFFNLIRHYVYQTPQRLDAVDRVRQSIPRLNVSELMQSYRVRTPKAYIGYAESIYDSIVRRAAIGKSGPIDHKKRKFYANHDKKKSEIIEIVRKSGIRLPIDYRFHQRSTNGIDFRGIAWIKDIYPADFEKIRFWFPLIDAELKRMEFRARYVKS
jgi:hypothetical protein